MKAIVANVLFGGILGCLSCANSTQANPTAEQPTLNQQILSTRRLTQSSLPIIPSTLGLMDQVLTTNELYSFNVSASIGYHQWLKQNTASNFLTIPQANYSSLSSFTDADCTPVCDLPEENIQQLLSSPQQPYTYKSQQSDLTLGFQSTFWASTNKSKYWGITTVEHWGNKKGNKKTAEAHLPQLNYTSAAPILPSGSSSLTFSGGGNRNLVQQASLSQDNNLSQEFEDFRGGITYHHGVEKQLTMGVGFVYEDAEDAFTGFTQLTYDSDILPLKTTISLYANESATTLHSHVRFKPAHNFVLNYYSEAEKHRFDANWGIYPGLTLIAKGNSKNHSYSTGIKVALQNNYFSLHATAALDHQQKLQWTINSQFAGFKFVHSSNQDHSNSELSNKLLESNSLGFECSAFVKYQTRQKKQGQQEFLVWGGKLQSKTKVSEKNHLWNLNLGYGSSSHGQGLIIKGSVALQPDLFLKLNYQEVSAVSDETKIKLQLSSN
ncbi:MAG: hypothetical protein AAFQ14_19585 [Cyanobacteria bacterium J06621_12]